jgi:hypothetical protein
MNIKDSLVQGFKVHAKLMGKIETLIDDLAYGQDLPSLLEGAESIAKCNIALLEQTRKYYEVFKSDRLVGVPEVLDAVDEIIPVDKESYKNSKAALIIGEKSK